MNAAGMAGHTTPTGSTEVVLKSKSRFPKMTVMESGSSRSKRLAATDAGSQLGIDATLQGNWKRELAPN